MQIVLIVIGLVLLVMSKAMKYKRLMKMKKSIFSGSTTNEALIQIIGFIIVIIAIFL